MVPILKQNKPTSSLQISHANKIIRNKIIPINLYLCFSINLNIKECDRWEHSTALQWNDPLEFPGSSQTIKLTISNQELFDVSWSVRAAPGRVPAMSPPAPSLSSLFAVILASWVAPSRKNNLNIPIFWSPSLSRFQSIWFRPIFLGNRGTASLHYKQNVEMSDSAIHKSFRVCFLDS